MKEVILVNSCSFLGLMHGIAWHGEKAPALLSQNNLLQHHTLAKRLCDKQAFNFCIATLSVDNLQLDKAVCQ